VQFYLADSPTVSHENFSGTGVSVRYGVTRAPAGAVVGGDARLAPSTVQITSLPSASHLDVP